LGIVGGLRFVSAVLPANDDGPAEEARGAPVYLDEVLPAEEFLEHLFEFGGIVEAELFQFGGPSNGYRLASVFSPRAFPTQTVRREG
jgi:hypothetical protein